jgi:hypothetical protein
MNEANELEVCHTLNVLYFWDEIKLRGVDPINTIGMKA